jgi:hypothetical protein
MLITLLRFAPPVVVVGVVDAFASASGSFFAAMRE